jgi:hypothetical protein
MILAAAAPVALLAGYWCAAQQPPNTIPSTEERKRRGQCQRDREEWDRASAAGVGERTRALMNRIETADPLADARAALDRGDFRLVRGMSMVATGALGIDCRTSARNSWRSQPLTLAMHTYSDVIPDCDGRDRQRCRNEKLIDAYGAAYNRAVVGDPRYPYADLCRPSAFAPGPRPSTEDPSEYGFPDLAPTDRPRDLHEAARRGTATSVARLIAAAPGAVDIPDPYDLTPLAWAVIRQRPDIAALLLDAGASPLGRDCDDPGRAESPLRLALRSGQETLARRLLSAAEPQRLEPWPEGLVEAAARGGVAPVLRRMLAEPREGRSAERLLSQARPAFPPQSLGVFDDYRKSLCWQGAVPTGARIRMVGAYESERTPDRGNHQPGPITVRLPASSTPVLLALSAYEPVEWRIEAPPSARLAGVVATGMYRPLVTGDIAGVTVLVNDRRDHCAALAGTNVYFYQADDEQQRVAQGLSRMLGVPVADFTGSYKAVAFELK